MTKFNANPEILPNNTQPEFCILSEVHNLFLPRAATLALLLKCTRGPNTKLWSEP